MPLVANTNLPSFKRLQGEGTTIIASDRALHQDIRELHIGLLNMMPDKALEATERQFFRLIGESNQIAQFYIHPFTLDELPRGEAGRKHIDQYYKRFADIKKEGLDALIISGTTPGPELSALPFWKPLNEIIDWAYANITSTLCSCLATHAVLQFRYGIHRYLLTTGKRWGVYSHKVMSRRHPLVADVNTRFDVPHSRFYQVDRKQMEQAGLRILVESEEAGVHLATSRDGFRLIFSQGHPEYDVVSLLKEYKREVGRYVFGETDDYPSFPENYFSLRNRAILEEYRDRAIATRRQSRQAEQFPEALLLDHIDNTWHDSAEAVINNWIGQVYQITHNDRRLPFRDDIDPDNPLGLA
ncbi:MAG: homoserine O-succinyltransferase [Gammaproteobacteria bacterium]|nr:homoserine O-succinyltransferase [Gammaproteobacteria bacterium]